MLHLLALTALLTRTTDRIRTRLADERGQTAAEYIGIIVVIAAVIGLITTTDIATAITDGITTTIEGIFGGGE